MAGKFQKGSGEAGHYWGHFTSTGTAVLELLPGPYTVIAEKGLEFDRIKSTVDLKADKTVDLAPRRWVHMASKGWWSGDFHIHRGPEVAQLLLRAEDLNLGVFFTMWNKQNYWKDKSLPADPSVRADSEHIATLMNEEDERGGGAWMMHNLKKPIDLSGAERWYPQGKVFIDQAKSQGGWFDSEKPIWWEAPIMAALGSIDSMGLVHNHYHQYGMMANEAWGRPRDQKLYFSGPVLRQNGTLVLRCKNSRPKMAVSARRPGPRSLLRDVLGLVKPLRGQAPALREAGCSFPGEEAAGPCCPRLRSAPFVAMVEATDLRDLHDLSRLRRWTISFCAFS